MRTHSIDDLLPHAPLHCAATGGDGQGFIIDNKPPWPAWGMTPQKYGT